MTTSSPALSPEVERLRLRFPKHEQVHPWLGLLLDALACIDAGTAAAFAGLSPDAPPIACEAGCSLCCENNHLIPVTPLEVAGLTWFCLESLKGETKRSVARNLGKRDRRGCPFLVAKRCAIYPLRPIACRRFIVFGQTCQAGEDVWVSRRHDVLTPIPHYKAEADRRMLPYYGVSEPQAIETALKQEYLRTVSQLLFSCSWGALAQAMAKRTAGLAL